MDAICIVVLSLTSAYALEFLIFLIKIVLDTRSSYINKSPIHSSQMLFYLLILLISIGRLCLIGLAGMPSLTKWAGMLVIFLNLLSCLLYSLILYHWYSTFSYISAEYRKSRQVIAKKLFIAINIHFIVYYAICILIGCGYDTIRPGDYVYMLLRVYQMYLILILFC